LITDFGNTKLKLLLLLSEPT